MRELPLFPLAVLASPLLEDLEEGGTLEGAPKVLERGRCDDTDPAAVARNGDLVTRADPELITDRLRDDDLTLRPDALSHTISITSAFPQVESLLHAPTLVRGSDI